MKRNLFTTTLAGLGLATLPILAEADTTSATATHSATTSEKTQTEPTPGETKTIPTYLVVFSGSG